MNEIELVEAASHGDKDAFCDLYESYQVRLYRYAYYRLGNEQDAEDAVSSCVLSAWEQIRKLEKPGSFAAWLFRILYGSCVKIIKAQIKSRNELGSDALDTFEAEKENGETDMDTRTVILETLELLSEETREMVLLSVIGGLTSKEIGEMYGMPQGTVRSRLSRSMDLMRKGLEI